MSGMREVKFLDLGWLRFVCEGRFQLRERRAFGDSSSRRHCLHAYITSRVRNDGKKRPRENCLGTQKYPTIYNNSTSYFNSFSVLFSLK